MTVITCILGSPRAGGNSDQVATAFCTAAETHGASVTLFALRDLHYSGCRNLFHCKNAGEHCGLDDDLQAVLESTRSADIVVLATPIYFTDICSQIKACIDRWFSFFVPDYPKTEIKSRLAPGKQVVWVQTQGEPESQYQNVLEKYHHSFRLLGFADAHLLRACGVREIGDIAAQSEVITQARALAERLASCAR